MSRPITAPAVGGGTTTGTNRLLILGCNCNSNTGDNSNDYINYNHITVCPITNFGKSKMNSTATTSGGYVGSLMNTQIIGPTATTGSLTGTINEQLYAEFGSHLKTIREQLSNSISTSASNKRNDNNDLGASNNWAWTWVQAVLMGEIEVFGSSIWSSSPFDVGSAKKQYPAFMYSTEDMIRRDTWYWLKDIVSGTRFSDVLTYGNVHNHTADTLIAVKPRFILA